MPIIISNKEGTRKIEEQKFEKEDKLQEYIYNNPEVLPIEEIEDDIPFIIVAREVQTNSGPIDAIGLDENGNIYVVETKLYKNSDKRKVISQVMDYGAALWKHTNDFGKFMNNLRESYRNKFDDELDDKLQSHFDIDQGSLDEYLDEVKDNLNDGKFQFVILMDRLDSRLKDLILFMNQNSMFDIYAVELDHYKFDGYHLSIPKLYGAEVKKSVGTSSGSNRKKWDEESYFEDLKKKVDDSNFSKIKKIYDETKESGEIDYGTGSINGSINFKATSKDGVRVSIYTYYSDGRSRLFFGYPLEESIREELKEKHGSNLRENNPSLPAYNRDCWKGEITHIEEVDEFIQFYLDVAEDIKNRELEDKHIHS